MKRASLVGWQTLLLTAAGVGPTACGSTDSEEDPARCVNPAPVVSAETGYVACDGGWVHRASAGSCPSTLPQPPTPTCNDADCTAAPNGYCALDPCPPNSSNYECLYGCVSDADCTPGNVCLCADPIGQCVAANCKSDADCGDGLCIGSKSGQSPFHPLFAPDGFHCQTPDDECLGDADCPAQGSVASHCVWNGSRHACRNPGVCGRPFLVDGVVRTADAVRKNEWGVSLDLGLDVCGLSGPERNLLVHHYTEMALMEHASIAAFARFTLELLALAAPSDLVMAAQSAMADEIQHARLCFGLAGEYAGTPIDPGKLPLEGALPEVSLFDVARSTIYEACIGETLAAIEAAEVAELATVPRVRSILRQIAEDEMRHAMLGWSFLHWVLQRATPGQRRALLAELELASQRPVTPKGAHAGIEAHGMLSARARQKLEQRSLADVIRPVARSLLAKWEVPRAA